ncbi:transcriptional regulator [bacterium]|nr:transcriptional regulator [bacterium]
MAAHRHYKRNSCGGRWAPAFSDESFIKTVETLGHGTPRRIAHEIGCSIPLAQIRLKKLNAAGSIDGELIGHSWVYRKCEQ